MANEASAKGTYSVVWGNGDGHDVVCYATGTVCEAENCRRLLRNLSIIADDERFTYCVRELTNDEYAEEIVGLEVGEADLLEMDSLIERLTDDLADAIDEAKRAADEESDDIEDESGT